MSAAVIAGYVFLGLGVVFNIIGNVGVLVFPDVYTRLQASSTCSTTSVFSILVGCMLLSEWGPMTGKLLVISVFFFVTNPISAHIIARFAWEREMVPWRRTFGRRSMQGETDG
jgi:multicomponent Na+:H+ antiporter subunit G